MSSLRRAECSACKARVMWIRFTADGITRPVEPCDAGVGNVAIQEPIPGTGSAREARIVSGIRTAYRLHLDTCPKAHVYRDRWKTKLACTSCRVPMIALDGGRSVCATCQAREREALGELAARIGTQADLVAALDAAARPVVPRATTPARGRR